MGAPQRPLVGFDGSPPAYAALEHAAQLTRRNHGLLTVVLVLRAEHWSASPCPLAPIVPPPYDFEKAAIDQLRDAVEELSEDISVVSLLCHGRVGPTLAREVGRHCCDAVVIGARCGLCSWLTGGVARYLRQHVQAPVLVVKPPRSTQQASDSSLALPSTPPTLQSARPRPA